MRKLLFVFIVISSTAKAQTNITEIGHVDYQTLHNTMLGGIWGYTDETGIEYALVGAENGVSIVSLADPTNPIEIFYEPGSNSIWREIRTYGDYAYVSTEANDGVLIIDLSPLPLSTTLPVTYFFGDPDNEFGGVHSLFIDENGILYLHGTNVGNGGVIFYDLNTSSTNPDEVGTFDNWYIHDSYARGDTLYAAHIYEGFFSVVDISDKSNPIVLATQETPNEFTHNTWLSDDGNYLFTTDEKPNSYICAYDISDLSNIVEEKKIRHVVAGGTVPHNTYYHNGYIITSYYTCGVTIHDAIIPNLMMEIGHFDTSPLTGDDYRGAWGVYPYLPSGNLLVTDMEEGLFILSPNYQRGCYLTGTVTDTSNSQPIAGVDIQILSQSANDLTDGLGEYGIGILTPGNYNVRYSKSGYFSDTIFNVALSSDSIIIKNVKLIPVTAFMLAGHVRDSYNGTPIPSANVLIKNSTLSYPVTTDFIGNFTIYPVFAGIYGMFAGKWGYVTRCAEGYNFNNQNDYALNDLQRGIYDDFTFDYGWMVSGDAPRGKWERAIPLGTLNGIDTINVNEDVSHDCGNYAFISGNLGGNADLDDVDSAATILTSPIFDLNGYADPYVNYSRWFVNKTITSAPNDSLQFYLDNGIERVKLEFCTPSNTVQSVWINKSIQVSSFLTPTSTMRLIVQLADWDAQGENITEGGLDNFFITEGPSLVNDISKNITTKIYPNPSHGNFTLTSGEIIKKISLIEITGRIIQSQLFSEKEIIYRTSGYLADGIYNLMIELENGSIEIQKIIVSK